jgi:hypothetical protein
MFVLNPDLGVYTHIVVNVYFPPSGELIPAVIMSSFPAEPYQYVSTMIVDIIFLFFWLHLFGGCVWGLVKAILSKSVKDYFKNMWNWLDWASAILGMVLLFLWLMFLAQLGTVQDMAMDVVQARPDAMNGNAFLSMAQRDDYMQKVAGLHTEVAAFSVFLTTSRLFVCWYTIMIMLRFFQAFLAQPKLAVVTNTVLKSIPDLLHFIIVLTLVFLAYSVAGMFLFGHRMLEFSEVSFALQTCFLIMLGDFDYGALAEEHLITAAIWFLSYMVLVSLIMLNMLLAIIMDIYSEVKADAEEQDPIWTQANQMARDFWAKREWVSLKLVEDVLKAWEDAPEMIDKDMLLRQVSMMPEDQALALIMEADKREEVAESKGLSISDAMKMVGWIKLAVQKIAHRIEDIMILEKEEKKSLIEQGRMPGVAGSRMTGPDDKLVKLDPVSETKLSAIDSRLAQMEEFLNESMCFTVHRGKEMRNRLAIIEDLLKADQNIAAAGNNPMLSNAAFSSGGAFGSGFGGAVGSASASSTRG